MKVGTDAVLLGAWADLPVQGRLLDVGTGTGILALMAAQRAPLLTIDAIDIDTEAVLQAQENIGRSPYADRIRVWEEEVREERLEVREERVEVREGYDCLICNPPFFTEALESPVEARSRARHAVHLRPETLVAFSAAQLREEGTLHVVLPEKEGEGFARLCFAAGLRTYRITHVKTTPTKEPKRVLLSFRKTTAPVSMDINTLTLTHDGRRSEAYDALTRDFYLW